ncbi:MAG: IS1595 family transposase [Kiloniellales bacterium]
MKAVQISRLLANEAKAIEYVESLIWPEGPHCYHCGATDKLYRIKANPEKRIRHGLWKCGHCRKQFTVRMGTIFEDSKIPMGVWLWIVFHMCTAKKGISACEIQRQTGLSYKAAWFACHRIRLAMTKEPLLTKLGTGGGIVEADETFIGGKKKNNKHRRKPGSKACEKIAVLTLVDREGEARTFKIPDTKKGTLQGIISPNVDKSAVIMTDENPSYVGLDDRHKAHHAVNHSETFVRAVIIHTNFAESYHALLKRSIIGTHHHLSEKHLHRYLREREFHWNRRKATDGERTVDAIQGAKGKRLIYRTPTA